MASPPFTIVPAQPSTWVVTVALGGHPDGDPKAWVDIERVEAWHVHWHADGSEDDGHPYFVPLTLTPYGPQQPEEAWIPVTEMSEVVRAANDLASELCDAFPERHEDSAEWMALAKNFLDDGQAIVSPRLLRLLNEADVIPPAGWQTYHDEEAKRGND